MRRGGEDELLAISPPPEFQDNPALPPPVLFRDLSPSANANNNNPGAQKNSLQKCIKEFADKVSYNILNEAMIISTLIPSPAGINDVRSQASTPSFPISSGRSYSSETISTGTSWEYLETSNSISDLRCLRRSSLFYTVEENNSRKNSYGQRQHPHQPESPAYHSQLKKSNSDALFTVVTPTSYSTKATSTEYYKKPIGVTNPESCVVGRPRSGFGMSCEVDTRFKRCVDPSNLKTNLTKTKSTNSSASILLVRTKIGASTSSTTTTGNKSDRCSCRRCSTSSSREAGGKANPSESCLPVGREAFAENADLLDDSLDVCYNVPFQCDIYSLPVDSLIKPAATGDTKTNNATNVSEVEQEGEENQSRKISKTQSSNNWRKSQGKLKRGCNNNSTPCGKTINNENCISDSICDSRMIDLDAENIMTRRNPRNKRTVLNHFRKNISSVEDSEGGELEDGVCEKIDIRSGSHAKAKSLNPASRLSERNNNENVTGDKMRSSKKRRSRSVEIDNQNTLNQRKLVQSTEAQLGEFSSSKGKRNFGHTLLNLFRRNRPKSKTAQLPTNIDPKIDTDRELVLVSRALPPPPPPDLVDEIPMAEQPSPVEPRDFAASIEKVKDCGWYWGPLASDEAEDLLRGEPDGSFIVRDSSDSHYIFSLTFKLNGLVRHVRIEHDQGNFSFGPLTRFKAATIVEFVEKAVAHSRSGRYLFFLHRRPVLGPMQVQLLHPYSRFRHPRSLQHMCRFVILKYVRRDLLNTLPLPKPLQDYLNTPHYYFEQQELSGKNT